jgi:4-amino-4-deoxy-L-arabinose transferase-like glycosyltransferase
MEENRRPLDRIDYWLALALTALALFVYVSTLTPSLSYLSPDGNELATIPYLLGLAHSPGYPVYTWLGKLFTLLPFGDIAHRVNLLSAAMGALSIGSLYLLITIILNPRVASPMLRRTAALFSAMLFAFSPTFWSQSVIAEVYAPNIAFIALTLLALLYWEKTRRDRDFFLFALAFGLSLGTHISNLGFAPAFVVFILLTDPSSLKRPRWWLAAIAGFGIGILQFLWRTLNDRMMLERAPVTIMGMYKYTLGAFSQIKFAFPIEELPLRLVLYIDLIRNEFGLSGILFGLVGLFSLLFRRTKYYFLLVLMYLVHVWFFIQYRVFDLEVFFLAAHFIWAIFIAFGITELLGALERLAKRLKNSFTVRILTSALALLTILIGLTPLARNWYTSDRSDDVAVNDFYANVWEILPENSALITRGGVMGYDAFYWPLIYNTRTDVFLPTLPTPFPVSTSLDGLAARPSSTGSLAGSHSHRCASKPARAIKPERQACALPSHRRAA